MLGLMKNGIKGGGEACFMKYIINPQPSITLTFLSQQVPEP
jgi:hypothetical protein